MLNRPEWLKQKVPNQEALLEMEKMLRKLSLNTVCESASCPNIGICFNNRTATFMIMGGTCTRVCRFCAVNKGKPQKLDIKEPYNVAKASKVLGLTHVVVTSVTRDDLEDGGAEHFSRTVKEIRQHNPGATIELLIPDLNGNWDALDVIVKSRPDIINHNVETVPALYEKVRPQAIYHQSLELLRQVKNKDGNIYTKSGLMLGLGEKYEEILEVIEDLVKINCDILTLGQYLQPSKDHYPVQKYVYPDIFDKLKKIAIQKGFKYVAAGPFVRSSYKAIEGLNLLRNKINKEEVTRNRS